jgi:nucleoside-diphosphate-sugar epimerase
MPEPPRILIAGYGDLGAAIGSILASDGMEIWGLRRSVRSHAESVAMLAGDVTRAETLACLAPVDPHILVYCVAAGEQSDDNYRAHYVDGLRNVLAALKGADALRHVFFVSSTRVYGQVGDVLLDENQPALPADFGGIRLLEAEHLLANLACGHTVLRLSGIYGPGRNRMLQLAAAPAQWPRQNAWSNRIHRDDAAAFTAFLIRRALSRQALHDCYLVTDSAPASQHEVLRWLASRIGVDIAGVISPSPSGGKRLANARMLESGFELRYPDYRAGYAGLVP